MLRIKNMPRGGGAESGAEVWFALETMDGGVHEFRLPLGQLEGLILGLRTFESEARRLYADQSGQAAQDAPAPHLSVDKFSARVTATGALQLGLRGPQAVEMRVVTPKHRVKALLLEIVRALAAAPAAPKEADPVA